MPHPKTRPCVPAEWLSVRQAAERVGVSIRTVKRWIAAKVLPATRLYSPKPGQGRLYIRVSDFECFLAKGRIG